LGVSRCVLAASTAASATGQAEALSGLAHALAEQHMLEGHPTQAESEFARALKLLEGLLVAPQRATTVQRSAEALLASGDAAGAALRQREAIDILRALGATGSSAAALHRRARGRTGGAGALRRCCPRTCAAGSRAA
jgi:hypothetical protein